MIEVRNLTHVVRDFCLGEFSFFVPAGEYFVVLGPTGAGKTMLLECIAGLHPNRPGQVWIEGHDVSAWTPEERNIGYVPQDYALFPFLSVRENILFPLRLRHRRNRVDLSSFHDIVELLRITHLLDRRTRHLSGGERQRVALARALVIRPKLLLLDEPYAALHAGLRRKLWMEMRLLHDRLGTTVIHVTHELEEAFTLCERVAVLIEGSLEQIGSKEEILYEPVNEDVAMFLGMINIFNGRVTRVDEDRNRVYLQVRDHEFTVPFRQGLSAGDKVGFCVHADRIKIPADGFKPTPTEGEWHLRARLVTSVSYGTIRTLYFKIITSSSKCGEYDLEVRLPAEQARRVELHKDEETTLVIKEEAVHIFAGTIRNSSRSKQS